MISTAQLKPENQFANPATHEIASIQGSLPGPTLIIVGGIHGNEPAGVLAADRVWLRMQERRAHLRGDGFAEETHGRSRREFVTSMLI